MTYQTYRAGTGRPAWVLSEVGSDRESDVKAALTSPACDSLCAALVENYSLTDSPASMATHQLLSTLRMDRYDEEAVATMEKGHVFAAAISKLVTSVTSLCARLKVDSPHCLVEAGGLQESDVKAALTSPACISLCAALVENYSLKTDFESRNALLEAANSGEDEKMEMTSSHDKFNAFLNK